MAITFRGFAGTGLKLDALWWSRYERFSGLLNNEHGVVTGATVAAAGGTRQLSVTALEAKFPGLAVISDASETVTVTANATGANRMDFLCLIANWSAQTVTLGMVQGSSLLPALTQTPGVTWQMPLAAVTVRPSVTTMQASDLRACKPVQRTSRFTEAAIASGTSMLAGGAAVTLATVSVIDTGWNHRLRIDGQVRFNASTGFAQLSARVDGVEIKGSFSDELNQGTAHMAHITAASAVRNAPAVVTLQMSTAGMTTGDTLEVRNNPSANFLIVEIVPV